MRQAKPPALSTCQRLLTLVHRSGLLTLTFRDPDNTRLAIQTANVICIYVVPNKKTAMKTDHGLVDFLFDIKKNLVL